MTQEDEYIVTATLHCAFCGKIVTIDTLMFVNGQMEPVICEDGHWPAAMAAVYLNLQHKTSPKMSFRRKNAEAR